MANAKPDFDAVVVGAGFAGMYMLYRLRERGLSVRVFETGTDVGGTWYWNRYPGARVDTETMFYSYQFSEQLQQEWEWKERYPAQAELSAYARHVADRFELRPDIQFETRVDSTVWDEDAGLWRVETGDGASTMARYCIMATGCLSAVNTPEFDGLNDFAGETYHTGQWPHEPVSFKGKRVAVIGTGSSGIQAIPEIAKEAEHVTVLQRTAQYAFPAGNRPITPDDMAKARKEFGATREKMIAHPGGFPVDSHERMAMDYTPEERRARYEELWERGSFMFFLNGFNDVATSEEANASLADFVRDKIRGIVRDKATAEMLMPDHFVMTKRPILDNGYFETFNRENVTLVDLREEPIERFTETSVVTASGEYPIDMLVLATGFDAISGSMLRLNPKGRDGMSLKDRWQDRFHNYLGMTITGFPNLFMIHGPGSPGVFYNMPLGAERQLDWIGNCMRHLREQGMGTVEPTTDSEEAWGNEVTGIASFTLFPRTDSWWTGANIPGKPRGFSAYLGGSLYYQRIADVADKDYEGFVFEQARHADDDRDRIA